MEEFLGIIKIFAGNFAPRGWALCDGSLLSISQNTALFSILGTTYGGNGTTTFALPDLRGRAPIGMGQGLGLQSYQLGEVGGTESVSLTVNNIPTHTHPLTGSVKLPCNGNATDSDNPEGAFPGTSATSIYSTTGPQFMGNLANTLTVGATGGSQPFSNTAPFLVVNYIICLEGIFPSRN